MMDQNTTLLFVSFAITALGIGVFLGKFIFDEIAHSRKIKNPITQRQNNNPTEQ
jgi:hypothetical protein